MHELQIPRPHTPNVMSWFALALLAPLLFSMTILVDKFIVEIQSRYIWGLALFTTTMGFVFGFIFWVLSGRAWLPAPDNWLVLVTGMFTIWGGIFYFKALSLETSSAITVLLNLQPPIILALSWPLLDETLTGNQILGFILTLAVALVFSAHRRLDERFSLQFSPALGWLLAANLLWSMGVVLFKFAVTPETFLASAAYESWGIFLGGAIAGLLFPRMRRDFRQVLRNRPSTLVVIGINESLFVAAKFIQLLAFTLGPVALVSVLGSTSVFFTMILAAMLTLWFPSIYKEDLVVRRLLARAGWATILVLGVWLIQH
ncbi:MAG: DMT family transporter [Chloroflexi bacterium]|nr:DMT family transporter [Chloroflexota bacterium]